MRGVNAALRAHVERRNDDGINGWAAVVLPASVCRASDEKTSTATACAGGFLRRLVSYHRRSIIIWASWAFFDCLICW